MFWILLVVLFISIVVGIIFPGAAIVFFKTRAYLVGKKITCRQIFDLIGY